MNILDQGLRIVSAGYSEIAKQYGENTTVIFVYCPTGDWILMNEDHAYFSLWKDVLQFYMGLESWQKREFYRADLSEDIKECMRAADRIVRIRRKRGRIYGKD